MLGQSEEKRLLDFQSAKAHVIIVMMNGNQYEGTIHGYDNAVIILDQLDSKKQKIRHTIYRHAIESFHTTSDVDKW